MTQKAGWLFATFLLVLPLDQATKAWVEANVHPLHPLPVIEGFFQITHARNPGGALGLFQETPVVVFIVLTIFAIGLVTSFYRQVAADDRLSLVALGLILGGAFGNLTDRLMRGEVVDFLQFDLKLFIFPDFNVADSAIVIGVVLLLRDLVLPASSRADGDPA
ncbi:MAG: signal peptidase II [Myxococcota bacterium]